MWEWLTCPTGTRSLYCSLQWALFVLAFLLAYVGWLNLRSCVRLLASINWHKTEDVGSEKSTSGAPGSCSSSLSTTLYQFLYPPDLFPVTSKITLGLLLLSFGLTIVTVIRASSSYPVYEYGEKERMVVLSTAVGGDPFTWYMQKNDGDFKAPWCRDYDVPSLGGAPGYHVRKIRYEDRGTCWSIARADLGIWWLRDPVTHSAIKEN